MIITAFTAHCPRPEAWELCRKYMERQTKEPFQWLVVDSSPDVVENHKGCDYFHRPDLPAMRDKVLFAIREKLIQGDAVVWWENDDWYSHAWLEWCAKRLERYDIVGQGNALYYHVRQRWMSPCANTRHASLCQTAIRSELLPRLATVIEGFDNNFFDTRLWRLEVRRYLHMPHDGERLVVGIKGMPGKLGYSHEHANLVPPNVTLDPALFHLWKHIGADAANYAPFFQR